MHSQISSRVEYWAKRIGKNIKEFSDDVTATENIKKVKIKYNGIFINALTKRDEI